MEKIQEVMYLPSLRCNLKCKHCGENQNVKAEDEIDCIQVLEQMKNSIMLDVKSKGGTNSIKVHIIKYNKLCVKKYIVFI